MQEPGRMLEQLAQPELVGNLTVEEATELKTLAKLEEEQVARVTHEQQLLNVTRAFRTKYAQQIVAGRDLPLADNYTMSDDNGRIHRTHRMIEPAAVVVESAVVPDGGPIIEEQIKPPEDPTPIGSRRKKPD